MTEIIQDTATVTFNVEEAIVSDTVKVEVRATMAVAAEDATDVRGQILGALKNVLDVEWAFVSLNRYEDQAGLERVDATATARIPEAQVAGLAKKAQAASVAGLKLIPGQVDYSPARNKVEEVIKTLRRKIYRLAQEEAEALQEAAGKTAKGKWRVQDITFNSGSASFANNARAMNVKGMALEATSYASAPAGGADGLDLTQKVGLSATVVLARTVL